MSIRNHRNCGRCHKCKEQRRSYMFGKMGLVIPDNIQTWITSQLLPYDSMETIAKVCIHETKLSNTQLACIIPGVVS